jgi:hypothetical protein
MTGADTSVWPIVLTGVFTLVGSLGGIGVGLVGAARRDAAQERREAKKRRADKFEELVAAVYEFDHWLTLTRRRELGKREVGVPDTASPFAKVQSISAVYFPQFSKLVDKLDSVSSRYLAWIYNPQEVTLSDTGEPLPFLKAYEPYLDVDLPPLSVHRWSSCKRGKPV